jgi:2-C-methyl-D-erythritol 4-phosphate cytidylyltransferase
VNAPQRGPLGAVIVAAGSGVRFGDPAKALAPLAGEPLLVHSLRLFMSEPVVEQIVVVLSEQTLARGASIVASLQARDVSICAGGDTRSASVRAGLARLDPSLALVAVHDAARPMASAELLQRVVTAAREHGAAVPGVPVVDTILQVTDDGFVCAAPQRGSLRAIQTPQVAKRAWLETALSLVDEPTDEGSLLHGAGHRVCVVAGDVDNLKITYFADIQRAEAILQAHRGQR